MIRMRRADGPGKNASRPSRMMSDDKNCGIPMLIPCAGMRYRDSVPRDPKVPQAVRQVAIGSNLKPFLPSRRGVSGNQVPQMESVRIFLDRVSRNWSQRTGCKSPCGGANLELASVSLGAVRRYGDLASLSMSVGWRSQSPRMSREAELARSNRIPVLKRGAVARLKKLVNLWTNQGDAIGDP